MISVVFALIALALPVIMASRSVIVVSSMALLSLRVCLELAGQSGVNYWFVWDNLSVPLILLSVWVGVMMVLASESVTRGQSSGDFLGCVMVLIVVLVASFCVRSFFTFYILFEMALLPTLFLIVGWGYQPERIQASMYLLLYTVSASLPLLASILVMNEENGGVSFLSHNWCVPSSLGLVVWWIITMAAFLVKSPMYLVHLWLPKAHVEAPVAGSMILAGVLLKLGGYGMLRVAERVCYVEEVVVGVTSVALVGGSIAGIICLRQADLKALIAYSSVTHMGLVLAAILSSTSWGWEGALLMMVAHGLASSVLFFLASLCYDVFETRSLILIKGILCISPVVAMMWFIALVANMGAPPSINFQGEVIMILGVGQISGVFLGLVACLSFFSAAYCFHVYVATQHGFVGHSVLTSPGVSARGMVTVFLHVFPIFLIMLNGEVFASWC